MTMFKVSVKDADGNEIAFATYRTGQEPFYTLREKAS
jgi:hypothetical protein